MHTLEITETFEVPVATLFRAWTQAEQLARWFAPGTMTVPSAEAQVTPGGHYRIVMQEDNGEQHIVGGTYLEVVDEALLRFSWCWEGSDHTTEVTVAFQSLSATQSSLTLTHSEFVDQTSCDKHQQGWQGCLANLLQRL
ncbi:SRPBCC family protein [Simiduia aestuariiviva]|uniref:Uncharacterized protein YndB with AHSA1/START domain n=1 Tax=Simiduia aestuariiviva TaxID=1510459 RepID=A0A839ULQ1_9GAMM|nr:SRPBCC domain-containing protein [Simiduia aestuariiviva]MBB3167691.1 uncharacterized protein YndB with AHSA1/START domain [Simiduia aestuariiviva]